MITSSTTTHLFGRTRDIEPNGQERRWEIYFDKKAYADLFPSEHKAWIELEWPSGVYRTRVGLKPNNPIYLWSGAQPVGSGIRTRVTDLLTLNSMDRAGSITFEVIVPNHRYRVVVEAHDGRAAAATDGSSNAIHASSTTG
mgnify:CR=1 FL=1